MKDKEIEEHCQRIGLRIKKIREWRHMSSGDLAQRIGASPSLVTRLENGESLPSLNRLILIAKELGVNLEDFLIKAEFELDVFRGEVSEKKSKYRGTMKDYDYQILLEENAISSRALFHPYLLKHRRTSQPIFHRHPGWEMIILKSEGKKLRLLFRKENIPEEKEEVLEKTFDLILFRSDLWHCYMPVDTEEVETICILSDTAVLNPETGKNTNIVQLSSFFKS